jgi:iron-sulfur cluster assembly protein
MIATAGPILDLRAGPRDRCLNPFLKLFCIGHLRLNVRRICPATLLAILSKAMITITDKGADKVREFLAAQGAETTAAGLRVGVRGGGCSGFQYQLAFDEPREDDMVFEDHGLKLLVAPQALEYVDGSQIDYIDALTDAGFKVENPNVVAACGCGSSFRVAGQEASCSPV